MAGSSGNNTVNLNHLVGLDPNPEIYEMIGFPSKNLHQIFNKQNDHLSAVSDHTPNEFLMVWNNHHHQYHQNRSFLVENDHQSLRCVFSCEGLSLSLSSCVPSSLEHDQCFDELGQYGNDFRFGPSSSKSMNINFQEQSYIRNSKYLGPAQDLLNEFCNLGTTNQKSDPKMKGHDETLPAIKKQSLYSLDLLELQRRKTKLLQMVEEVDRRYKHYCDQMKAVVQSFEAVAGDGAAAVYSALASRAMSRHFRCLKDGILDQIKAVKNVMGEKDVAVPGTVKGETPRLRVLDQTLRQQRALQQMSLMDSHPWRPQRGLPERSVSVLRAWLFEHFLHPYPSDVDKHILARQTGLSRSQVSNWFINARVRLWKPMVEEMYMEELKENQDAGVSDGAATSASAVNPEENKKPSRTEDQKPTHDQLKNPSFGRVAGDHSYNAMELDFSSYTGGSAAVTYANENSGGHNYGNGGVSLTLGLHQHGGASGGMSLAFSTTSQNSLFYPRDHMEDCQTAPYSLLESENQNLPYRNLMGAQLLHDLAG